MKETKRKSEQNLLKSKVITCPKCKNNIIAKCISTLYTNEQLVGDSKYWGHIQYKKFEGFCCNKKVVNIERKILSEFYKEH